MSETGTLPTRGDAARGESPWLCLELPTVEYRAARLLQQRIVAARLAGHFLAEVALVLEHHPVFTLGRRAGRGNLLVSDRFLDSRGIPLEPAERGGDITYHGPGQLVIYPIVDLRRLKLGVAAYVERLEEVMIRLAADQGVRATRSSLNHGVWVGDHKLGSLGVAVRRGIAFHGLALNVALPLEPFTWIHPCGLAGVSMTCLARETGRSVAMAAVRQSARRQLASVFGCRLDAVSVQELQALLEPARREESPPP
jgi:lipoate-protein ligase B